MTIKTETEWFWHLIIPDLWIWSVKVTIKTETEWFWHLIIPDLSRESLWIMCFKKRLGFLRLFYKSSATGEGQLYVAPDQQVSQRVLSGVFLAEANVLLTWSASTHMFLFFSFLFFLFFFFFFKVIQRPRTTVRLSRTTGQELVYMYDTRLHWSALLSSCSNWSDHTTESESGPGLWITPPPFPLQRKLHRKHCPPPPRRTLHGVLSLELVLALVDAVWPTTSSNCNLYNACRLRVWIIIALCELHPAF